MNSSDTGPNLGTEAAGTPLIRLLLAMSVEWAEIARQIQTVGDAAAASAAAEGQGGGGHYLQAFDLIHQRAQGQANLLSRLSQKLAEDQFFDRKRLGDLIADIPFHSVRAGLEAAFDGRKAMPETEKSDDDVDWL